MTSSKKIAKAIRKEIKYHPTQERVYAPIQLNKAKPSITYELDPVCTRVVYQEMKKERRNDN